MDANKIRSGEAFLFRGKVDHLSKSDCGRGGNLSFVASAPGSPGMVVTGCLGKHDAIKTFCEKTGILPYQAGVSANQLDPGLLKHVEEVPLKHVEEVPKASSPKESKAVYKGGTA